MIYSLPHATFENALPKAVVLTICSSVFIKLEVPHRHLPSKKACPFYNRLFPPFVAGETVFSEAAGYKGNLLATP